MLVLLKRTFFAEGTRFRPNPYGTEMPDRLRKQLPKDATVLADPELELEPPPAKFSEPETLGELARIQAKEQELPSPPAAPKPPLPKVAAKKED